MSTCNIYRGKNEYDLHPALPVTLLGMSASPGHEDRLRTRLVVAFLGIPALLAFIRLGGIVYAVFVTAMVLLGLWEYFRLLRAGGLTPRPVPSYLAALMFLAACFYHVGFFNQRHSWETLGWQLILIVFLLIMVLQAVEVLRPTGTAWMNLSANLVGVLWVAGFGSSFILVRSADITYLRGSVDLAYRLTLSLYVSVWVCDSLAYLLGKRFGIRKILPLVSPGKTIVGTISGLIGALFTIFLFGLLDFLPKDVFPPLYLLALGLIVGVAGQLGDLVESRMKRDFKVKDTGTLLPGHGGVLDRFDSLLFVMPLAYLFLKLTLLP